MQLVRDQVGGGMGFRKRLSLGFADLPRAGTVQAS